MGRKQEIQAKYDWPQMLAMIEQGFTLRKACLYLGIPPKTVYVLAKRNPDFNKRLQLAQEIGIEMQVDGLADIHEVHPNPLMARTISQNIQWIAAHRNADRYGDKTVADDKRTTDLTSILREAIARIPRPDSDQKQIASEQAIDITDIFGPDTLDNGSSVTLPATLPRPEKKE